MTDHVKTAPSVSVKYAATGASKSSNEFGMRAMQERAYQMRGEQYLLIKSPPASGKSRALMFIALDKLANQGLQQAIIVVPERSIGASFKDTPLSHHGSWADWTVAPQWNLCNAPGADDPKVAKGKVAAVRAFLGSDDEVLVCTHATPVHPREWFIVPVDFVLETVELLQDKSLHQYEYRPEEGKIIPRPGAS